MRIDKFALADDNIRLEWTLVVDTARQRFAHEAMNRDRAAKNQAPVDPSEPIYQLAYVEAAKARMEYVQAALIETLKPVALSRGKAGETRLEFVQGKIDALSPDYLTAVREMHLGIKSGAERLEDYVTDLAYAETDITILTQGRTAEESMIGVAFATEAVLEKFDHQRRAPAQAGGVVTMAPPERSHA